MSYSKKRKLGSTLWEILRENERRYLSTSKESPLTDKEILGILIRLFPKAKGLKSMVAGALSINRYRSMMNRGHYYRHLPPMWPPSFRYNRAGQRVSARSGLRVLTFEEQDALLIELKPLQAGQRAEHEAEIQSRTASSERLLEELH